MHSSYCLVSFALIGASIYTILNYASCKEFEKSLDEEQLASYKKIVGERRNLYIWGLILGILLSVLYIYFGGKHNNCVFTAIIFGTQFMFYMLAPKGRTMMEMLKNEEQLKLYAKLHRNMQFKFFMGALIGIVGFLILGAYLGKGRGDGVRPQTYVIMV